MKKYSFVVLQNVVNLFFYGEICVSNSFKNKFVKALIGLKVDYDQPYLHQVQLFNAYQLPHAQIKPQSHNGETFVEFLVLRKYQNIKNCNKIFKILYYFKGPNVLPNIIPNIIPIGNPTVNRTQNIVKYGGIAPQVKQPSQPLQLKGITPLPPLPPLPPLLLQKVRMNPMANDKESVSLM